MVRCGGGRNERAERADGRAAGREAPSAFLARQRDEFLEPLAGRLRQDAVAAPERGERAHGDDFAHGQCVDRAGALLLAAPGIVLDGFDGQLIGFAIPVLIREWGITRGAFAPAVAAGLIGMGIVCVALLAVRRHIPRLPRAAAQPREGEELARTSS